MESGRVSKRHLQFVAHTKLISQLLPREDDAFHGSHNEKSIFHPRTHVHGRRQKNASRARFLRISGAS